jgi:hypothetical protein
MDYTRYGRGNVLVVLSQLLLRISQEYGVIVFLNVGEHRIFLMLPAERPTGISLHASAFLDQNFPVRAK